MNRSRTYTERLTGPAARLEREDAERVEARELTITRGSGALRGRLDPEAVEELLAALDPLAAPRPGVDGVPDPRSAARRRADALVELIRVALGCGELPQDGGELPHLLITVPLETLQSRAEGDRDPGGHQPSTDPRRAAGPHQDADTHPGPVPAPEQAAVRAGELPDGSPVPAEAARRVGCDAVLMTAILNSVGMVEAMGRSTRAIPRRLRRALVARDRGCAFPGCDRPAGWCQGHHIVHWAHGGRTDLDNLVLVCAHHHRVIHHGGWTVHIGANGLPVFTPPRWIDPDQTPHTRPWRTALDHLPLRT